MCVCVCVCVCVQIDALSEVVSAVQGRVEVFMDGGVRQGTDVLKALAMGARAVFIGRPVLWGLAYNVRLIYIHILELLAAYFMQGEEGVSQVLQILRDELKQAMLLCGGSHCSHQVLPALLCN